MKYCHFKIIPENLFKKQTHLLRLYLNYNFLSNITSATFNGNDNEITSHITVIIKLISHRATFFEIAVFRF